MIDPFTANFLVGLGICGATAAVLYGLKWLIAPKNNGHNHPAE